MRCGDMNEIPAEGMKDSASPLRQTDAAVSGHDLVAEKLLHPDALGRLVPGRDKHFYSSGAFNLIQLIFHGQYCGASSQDGSG